MVKVRMMKAFHDSVGEKIIVTKIEGVENPTTTTGTELSQGDSAYIAPNRGAIFANRRKSLPDKMGPPGFEPGTKGL
jgi:hypothetical protein